MIIVMNKQKQIMYVVDFHKNVFTQNETLGWIL